MPQKTYVKDDEGKACAISKLYARDTGGLARKVSKLYIRDANGLARLVYGACAHSNIEYIPIGEVGEWDTNWRHDVYCTECKALLRAEEDCGRNGSDSGDYGIWSGEYVKKCKCGHLYERTGEEVATCSHSNTVHDSVQSTVTCTEAGWYVDYCRDCQTYLRAWKEALGHDEYVWLEQADPTCTVEGRTQVTKCRVCGTTIDGGTVIPALGHTGGLIIDNSKPPTCTVDGWYSTYSPCSRCGESYGGGVWPAAGHKPGAAATCTTAQTCTVCGVTLTPKRPHTGMCAVCGGGTCSICGYTISYSSSCSKNHIIPL